MSLKGFVLRYLLEFDQDSPKNSIRGSYRAAQLIKIAMAYFFDYVKMYLPYSSALTSQTNLIPLNQH